MDKYRSCTLVHTAQHNPSHKALIQLALETRPQVAVVVPSFAAASFVAVASSASFASVVETLAVGSTLRRREITK